MEINSGNAGVHMEFSDRLRKIDSRFEEILVEDINFDYNEFNFPMKIIRQNWIWSMNAEYTYTFVSPKVKQFLGYEVNDLVGKSFFDFIHISQVDLVKNILQYYSENKMTSCNIKIKVNDKNGEIVLVKSHSLTQFDENNNITGYEGVSYLIKD